MSNNLLFFLQRHSTFTDIEVMQHTWSDSKLGKCLAIYLVNTNCKLPVPHPGLIKTCVCDVHHTLQNMLTNLYSVLYYPGKKRM